MIRYSKRPRLEGFNYIGRYRYFITICTYQKHPVFRNEVVVASCLKCLKEKALALNFKLWAYCFMPDHLHFLVEGKVRSADLKRFISLFKQVTGYNYAQNKGQCFIAEKKPKLWQPSFYDHVLREEEDLIDVARYILNNPVRKGLAIHYREYRHSGPLAIKDGLRGDC